MKDFDTFSFQGKNQESIHTQKNEQQNFQQVKQSVPIKNWRQMSYRFQKKSSVIQPNIKPVYQSHFINQRISRIDEELTQNIRRRIQLQKRLYVEKQQIRQKQNQKLFKQNNCKNDQETIQTFVNMQKKSHDVQTKLARNKEQEQQKSYLRQVQQKQSKNQLYLSKIQPKPKKVIVPDQIKIQKLLRQTTFPQMPQRNLNKLQQQCQQIMLNSEHSDILYMMMVISFHQQKYHNVRKYFRQIQMYKVFEMKAYWVACQTQFELQNYELCLKLADKCMRQISDVHLPRFVFLQARCYEKIGNFINCIVCYNQLIKMKPKVAQLYLERALIYDKIGYPMQAKQDYIQFSILQPTAKQILRQKIMIQKNQIKRKELIKALAKIT